MFHHGVILVTSDMANSNEERQLKLKPETTEKIRKIDGSLVFWSLQLGQAMMRLREIEAQIGGLYDFKKTVVLEDLKLQEVNIEGCDVSTVDDQTVKITKSESQPPVPLPFAKPGG